MHNTHITAAPHLLHMVIAHHRPRSHRIAACTPLRLTPITNTSIPTTRRSPTHPSFLFFFFNDTATPEFYPFSLPDALPISCEQKKSSQPLPPRRQQAHSQSHSNRLASQEGRDQGRHSRRNQEKVPVQSVPCELRARKIGRAHV